MGSEGADPWGLHSLQTAPGLNCGSRTWGFTGSPPELDFSPRLGVPLWALGTPHPQELPGSPWASLNCHGCFLRTCQVCKIPNRTYAQPPPRSSPSLSSTVHIPVILPVTRLKLTSASLPFIPPTHPRRGQALPLPTTSRPSARPRPACPPRPWTTGTCPASQLTSPRYSQPSASTSREFPQRNRKKTQSPYFLPRHKMPV